MNRRTIACVSALSLLGVALFGALSACGASYGPISGDRAYTHTDRIVALGPRPPGSENLRKTADYLAAELAAIDPALKLQRQRFREPKSGGNIEFENVWVEIPGDDPENGPIIAVAAHYDSKVAHGHGTDEHNFEFVGALDSAASCGVLIELARELHVQKPLSANVWLIWFDGEESLDWDWNDERALFGSRHFAATLAADKERFPGGLSRRFRALVLLDLLGDPELKIDRDLESHPTLLDIFESTAKEMGVGEVMYRFDSPMKDDHIAFKNYGVKVIDLIDFRFRPPQEHGPNTPAEARKYTPWWHTAQDDMSNVSASSLSLVGNLVWRALPTIESELVR